MADPRVMTDPTMMHAWSERTDILASSLVGYAVERVRLAKNPKWGARPSSELNAELSETITPEGVGGHETLRIFRDLLVPSCRPMDDPLNLAYVPTAPTQASVLFDLVVSASSIFAGNWEAGSGAIAAENRALAWLAELAGLPVTAGGCFVAGGSAANLSALVTARHGAVERLGVGQPHPRWKFAATREVHASAKAAGRVMDVDVIEVPSDDRGRMTGRALDATLDRVGIEGVFAVVATAGTTNAGAIDDLPGIARVCADRGLWMHVDGAYGAAALCSPTARPRFEGIESADSFSVDPHKWLFAPYDAAALVYREPRLAAAAHTQTGEYLDEVDRDEWNPSDYAFHLSRRARGLPLWFSLATYGTDAYAAAMDKTLATAQRFADAVAAHPHFELLLEPDLSVVLFRRCGWNLDDYRSWSHSRAMAGTALIVPTAWMGQPCFRICVVNPLTEAEDLIALLDDMV
jgi:glutamate/tyrosine decarboxylase-like PLP-dependent enzyme